MSFELHDPVLVKHGDVTLEGVIVYIGHVDFSPSNDNAGNDDWIGVRLTGDSVEQGTIDGSLHGKTYFSCPPNGGLLVQSSAVMKREVTRLEEIKIRRELGLARTTGSHSSVPPSADPARGGVRTTPIRRSTLPSTVVTASTQSVIAANDPTSSAPTPAASAKLARLNELRQLRAARKTVDLSTVVHTANASRNQVDDNPRQAAQTATSSTISKDPVQNQRMNDDAISSVGALSRASSLVSIAKDSVDNTIQYQTMNANDSAVQSIRLRRDLDQMAKKIENKENEVKRLESELHSRNQQVKSLEEQISEAHQNVKKLSVPTTEQHLIDTLRMQVRDLEQKLSNSKDSLDSRQSQIEAMKQMLQDQVELDEQLSTARAEALSLMQEIQIISSQNETRGIADASHYKERAKLQALIASQERKVEQLEREKQELNSAFEDLTLDKEQLEQERESLQDRLEELKLDAETALMEAEELKLELEDAQASIERTARVTQGSDDNTDDMSQALSLQNARLREAIIRLREQSSIEKLELSRQLRDAEKDAELGRAVSSEYESLKTLNATLEEQINDLKDMVEQGSAFESMVEDLSDRVLSIEDENNGLRSTIRQLEEATELTAEMEELQADELKVLNRDLQGRDTIIRNLEEAIKMQRRREDDLLCTVKNYRTTVATLKQEKLSLLELHQGGEGEKIDLILSSQNALSRAAQLVTDNAEVRRRDAQTTVDAIERQIYKNLSNRLESLLPHSLVRYELSAIHGELQAAKSISLASKILHGILEYCTKSIRPVHDHVDQHEDLETYASCILPDEVKQKALSLLYQAEFSFVIINASSAILRLLVAGQWPNLLSHDASVDLGTRLGHFTPDIDAIISSVLKCLKEEGTLNPEHSNMEVTGRNLQIAIQSLLADMKLNDKESLVPTEWNPPGMEIMKDASTAKFACVSITAALSEAVFYATPSGSSQVSPLYNVIWQISCQSISVCQHMSSLNIVHVNLSQLSTQVSTWKDKSLSLFASMKEFFMDSSSLHAFQAQSDEVLHVLVQISSTLRVLKMSPSGNIHPLSPESDDYWERLAALARSVRSIDGDEDDVHFVYRARSIEQRLSSAIEMGPKLELANSRISLLEKNITLKTKEVLIMSARLFELENLIAKTNIPVGEAVFRSGAHELRSSDDLSTLQEENRMLSEAMDVLNRQVEEYENEIRALKDFKSPSIGNQSRKNPRRSLTTIADSVASPLGKATAPDDLQTNTGILEATLFRPALQRALKEAAFWKTSVVRDSLANLQALPFSKGFDSTCEESSPDNLLELTRALADYRVGMSSISLVDLTGSRATPKQQLRMSDARLHATSERLHSIVRRGQLLSIY